MSETAPHAEGATDPLYDFFVSYDEADRGWAEWIAWTLEQDGYRILLEHWDLVAGGNRHVFLQEGMARSKRTLAIVSQRYLGSAYGGVQWRAAWGTDLLGTDRKLIPIRIDDCDLREPLRSVVAIDLAELDKDEAGAQLLTGISVALAGRNPPLGEPTFPPGTVDTDTFAAVSTGRRWSGVVVRTWTRLWRRGGWLVGTLGVALEATGVGAQAAGRAGVVGVVAGVLAVGVASALVVRCALAPRWAPSAVEMLLACSLGLLGAAVGAESLAIAGTARAAHSPLAVVVEVLVATTLVYAVARPARTPSATAQPSPVPAVAQHTEAGG
ncbi:toll/interleukin-1 receptor domain-containing protein [Candidatus Frankia nodulisporulans]|uniref:toll/interleukin-1 receptor domain-containing protein n=1 Tax=Candidatus Frankia nodulisporulans TaxID=2060052 RepID=UPI0013D581F4|nr:toll/interleukin-1 receptor domain-containing protein [Candidatus Frankia nodulisporulans]